jgi:diamine N-acetyltransferase
MGALGEAVTLREITAESVRAICRLRVTPAQESLVAPNAVSIAQAYFEPAAWFRAICAGDEPVGFAMLFDPTRAVAPETPHICHLWRFMIAAPHQRQGHGRAALSLLIDHAKTLAGVTTFSLSFVPAEGSPRDFYAGLGFRETGEVDEGEVVMALAL